MSDRLENLRRQRALLQEHLAWIEQEIAAAGGQVHSAPPEPAPVSLRPPSFDRLPSPVPAAQAEAAADAMMADYSRTPGDVKQDVKKGCFVYFAVAFLLLGLAVLGLYLHTKSRH